MKLVGVVALVLVGVGWVTAGSQPFVSNSLPADHAASEPTDAVSPPRQAVQGGVADEILANLARISIVPVRSRVGSYDRSCSPGRGCVFGPAWTDDQDAPGGHNGCGTRDDVLASQLKNPVRRPGSRCVIVAGTLDDPYTGRPVQFAKADAAQVQVDHLIPLAAAWDLGAWEWSYERRVEFANDVEDELIAVEGKVNQEKGDRTPGEWLPPNEAFHCEYVRRYVRVTAKYDLSITAVDAGVIRRIAGAC